MPQDRSTTLRVVFVECVVLVMNHKSSGSCHAFSELCFQSMEMQRLEK